MAVKRSLEIKWVRPWIIYIFKILLIAIDLNF